MGKKSRVKARTAAAHAPAGGPADGTADVGPRQPCPCGSGRRYKACHGSATGPVPTYVARPFAGVVGECDLIAMREIVAAATAPLTLKDGVADGRTVLLCSLLPMAAPALARDDGSVWLGLQVQHGFGDPSRDLAAVLLKALEAEPGAGVIGLTDDPGAGPRLQDLVTDAPLEVTVHDGFGYWVADVDDPDGSVAASLESANAAAHPSVRLDSVEAAYWTDVGTREHLRWVLPYDEEPALDALARLFAADGLTLGDATRYIGSFRAHGLVVPVWDLASSVDVDELEAPTSRLAERLDEAAADRRPLTDDELRARRALAGRQVTIR